MTLFFKKCAVWKKRRGAQFCFHFSCVRAGSVQIFEMKLCFGFLEKEQVVGWWRKCDIFLLVKGVIFLNSPCENSKNSFCNFTLFFNSWTNYVEKIVCPRIDFIFSLHQFLIEILCASLACFYLFENFKTVFFQIHERIVLKKMFSPCIDFISSLYQLWI